MASNQVSSSLALLAAALVIGGCQRNDDRTRADAPPQRPVSANVRAASFSQHSARQYLTAVFQRYRGAASYHDSAEVRLTYRLGSQVETTAAPLSVWYAYDQLIVHAYDTSLRSGGEGLIAWIDDPDSNSFDSQVLVGPSAAGRPSLEAVFADPILADRVSSGLAGPPPQLDWLFAADPMAGLFQAASTFAFGAVDTIDRRECRAVTVTVGQEEYRFWIDRHDSLIRRVEFPEVLLPGETPGSPTRTEMTIELRGAAFASSSHPPRLPSLPRQPKYVSRFVPLPTARPASVIGTTPKGWVITDDAGKVTIRDGRSDREICVLVRLADDPASDAAVSIMNRWYAQLPETIQQRVRVGVIAATGLRPEADFPVFVQLQSSVAQRLQLPAGAAMVWDARGRVAWIQPDLSSDASATAMLGAVVADLLGGVDVPQRVLQQWDQQVKAYRAALARHAVDK